MNEMDSVTEKTCPARAAIRSGRPPRELAGEVEGRILDAACQVFLERGFEGASIEEIAEVARAGKPTIYARFPNKGALFAAALARELSARVARVAQYAPKGATPEEKVMSIAVSLVRETLTKEWLGLVRLAIAETRRFPDLGNNICRTAREQGAEAMARLLAEVAATAELGTLPAFSPENCATAARYLAELTLLPLLLRALAGESLEALHAEIVPHVSKRVVFFLAACRHGGITR
ncbi:MAG: helix-turn-helix domain-containing protein [Rhodomicrobium sp.]